MDDQRLNQLVRERYGAEHVIALLKTRDGLPSQYLGFLPDADQVWRVLFTGRALRLVALGSKDRFLESTLLSRGETGLELGIELGDWDSVVLRIVRSKEVREVHLDRSVRLEVLQQVLMKLSELFAGDDLAKVGQEKKPSLSACRVCSKPVKPYSVYCKWCGTKVQVAS